MSFISIPESPYRPYYILQNPIKIILITKCELISILQLHSQRRSKKKKKEEKNVNDSPGVNSF